ncbi:MAG TPA: class F sortase [Dehalococcoidia bacterium]|nr:class F sortase [Dehalococcoidia bacterium]
MRWLLGGPRRLVWGRRGASRAARAYRLGAAGCFVAAVLLLAFGAYTAANVGPSHKKLARGIVFDQPLATAAVPASAGEVYGPPLPPSPAPDTATPSPSPSDTPVPQTAWVVEPASPTPAPSQAGIVRLKIPAIKVDAPISVKGVDSRGVMEDPNSWNDVVWYNFSGRPGFGSGNNAVFAGHVDYIRHGPAVFWDLNKLKPGDPVDVVLGDGTDYTYHVTSMAVYGANDAPVDQIIGPTGTESVTLITCNGTFSAGEYNNRLVVRAERLASTPLPLDRLSPGE